MTLLVSWFSFILIHTAIYHSAQSCDTTDRFNQKWFGADCQYKCHCKNNVACDVTNGDCPNGCDIGWFGPACQYMDLAKTAQLELTDGAPTDRTKITDGDDTTCASLTGSNFSLHITWNSDIYFTWLRLVVGNGELQKESISIKFPDDLTTQDMECKKVFVDKLIIDIYCNISKPLQGIVLNGSTVSTLCSLYISKGRNVALKQPTNQTTTFPDSPFYISSSAVDGNTEWGNHSCTHTNESGDPTPTWTLYFKSIVTVASYTIYNRVDLGDPTGSLLKRLKGFILRTVDQTNNIVQIYIDTETSALTDYNFISADPWAQVSKVQITATYQLPTIVLTLCEVEIFGDSVCPRDKFTYGRDCENVCNCAVEGERCLVSTGNCPSGCKAGFFGQGCKKTCDSGYFGIDCRKKCSNCSGLQCDGIDGKCTSCATTGKKLPYCIEDCDPGFYGSDCKSNCSQNCSQTGYICDAMDGKCFACKPGFYGSYCTTPCSSNCKVSICDIKYGICISCRAGFQGDKCDEECSKSTYGESCKAKCSSNCNTNCNEARNCDNENGHCLNGCQNGFEGLYCSTSTSKSNIGLASGVGIGIGVTIAADIVIGIVIYIWYKRRQKPPPKPLDTAVRSYDHVDPIQQNEHQYYTVDKSGDGYDLIQDVVAFNKKNNSVVTAVHRESHKNTGGSSVSS